MEIKELKRNLDVLSREFLKREEEENRSLKFIQKQHVKLLEKENELIQTREILLRKTEGIESFERKLWTVNLINKIFIGAIVCLILGVGIFSWQINAYKKEIRELKSSVNSVLLGDKRFWYDKKDMNLYLRSVEKLDEEKN